MIYNLNNPHEHEGFKNYVNKLYTERAVVEIKKKSHNRSLSQNSYLHLLLSYFACEYGCSLEEAKLDFFKRECNRDLFEIKLLNKVGREITTIKSTKELTTSEMATAIDRFRNWASAVLAIYLPSANEKDFLIHVQQEIQKNKLFI